MLSVDATSVMADRLGECRGERGAVGGGESRLMRLTRFLDGGLEVGVGVATRAGVDGVPGVVGGGGEGRTG